MGVLSSIWLAARRSRLLPVSFDLLRRCGPGNLFGPLFTYELIRLARRGRSTLLRFLYALFLLGALANAYLVRFGGHLPTIKEFSPRTRVTIQEMADFSRLFITGVLLVQGGMVLVVTPVYLAGAVSEEKERKTLALLFASHLSDREIILGKLMSRLTLLGSLLLTGLPVLVLTSLMAQRAEQLVMLTTFAVTVVTLLSVGSLSILCSVRCRNSLTALLCSYGFLFMCNLPGLVPCALPYTSPLGFLFTLDLRLDGYSMASDFAGPLAPELKTAIRLGDLLPMTLIYLTLHGLFGALCTKLAIDNLRTAEPDPVFHTPPATERLVPISSAFDVSDLRRKTPEIVVHRASLLPPMNEDPLLWREIFHDPPARRIPARTLLAFIGGAVLLGCLFYWVPLWLYAPNVNREPITRPLNYILRVSAIVLACLYAMGLALRTASCISRERDRNTLEMLLTVPDNRPAILRAKWLGGLLRLRFLGLLLVGVLLLGLFTKAFHPLAFLLFVGYCAAVLVFLASVGVWISLMARTTMWAQLSMVLLLLLLFLVPWLWLLNQRYPGEFSEDPREFTTHLWQIGFNPVAAWWMATSSWTQWRESLERNADLFQARLGAIVYGFSMLYASALLFWLAARRRLNREPVK